MNIKNFKRELLFVVVAAVCGLFAFGVCVAEGLSPTLTAIFVGGAGFIGPKLFSKYIKN